MDQVKQLAMRPVGSIGQFQVQAWHVLALVVAFYLIKKNGG